MGKLSYGLFGYRLLLKCVNSVVGPSFKFFWLKKVLVGPMNNVRDPLLFSKMQERTENVRSKCDLEI